MESAPKSGGGGGGVKEGVWGRTGGKEGAAEVPVGSVPAMPRPQDRGGRRQLGPRPTTKTGPQIDRTLKTMAGAVCERPAIGQMTQKKGQQLVGIYR